MNEELDRKARELMALREQPLTSANYVQALRDVDNSTGPRIEYHNEGLVADVRRETSGRAQTYAELKASLLEASRRQAEPRFPHATDLQRERARMLQADGIRKGFHLSEEQCLHVLSFG